MVGRLILDAVTATVLGNIFTSTDVAESDGSRIKQWVGYHLKGALARYLRVSAPLSPAGPGRRPTIRAALIAPADVPAMPLMVQQDN